MSTSGLDDGQPTLFDASTADGALGDAALDSAADAPAADVTDGSLDARPPLEGGVIWAANGHQYALVRRPEGITWASAKDEAVALGGHLATITTVPESQFIGALLVDLDGDVWLGGTQPAGSPEPAGGFVWITGEPFTFTNWGSSEPNNQGDEDTVVASIGGTWNDQSKLVGLKAYVVEIE